MEGHQFAAITMPDKILKTQHLVEYGWMWRDDAKRLGLSGHLRAAPRTLSGHFAVQPLTRASLVVTSTGRSSKTPVT
jgi:hypothetical protein